MTDKVVLTTSFALRKMYWTGAGINGTSSTEFPTITNLRRLAVELAPEEAAEARSIWRGLLIFDEEPAMVDGSDAPGQTPQPYEPRPESTPEEQTDMLKWEFKHYNRAPKLNASDWRWHNFSAYELRCRGSNRLVVVPEALDKLQAVRTILGKPMPILSAYRSPGHNLAVGGAPNSKHLEAVAFDIGTAKLSPEELIKIARFVGFNGIGRYPTRNFVHIDLRPAPAEWKG